MDKATFWLLIEGVRKKSKGDTELQVELLHNELVKQPAEEIIEFDGILNEQMALSYTNDLWAAAYLINGGCSDDCFDYFRGWLIAQGQVVFDNALKDPETLVDIAESEEVELESILYVAWEAYEEKTGSKFPMSMRPEKELAGDDWDEDDLEVKYPKLWSKFG